MVGLAHGALALKPAGQVRSPGGLGFALQRLNKTCLKLY